MDFILVYLWLSLFMVGWAVLDAKGYNGSGFVGWLVLVIAFGPITFIAILFLPDIGKHKYKTTISSVGDRSIEVRELISEGTRK